MENFVEHVIRKHIIPTDAGTYVSWDSVYDELMDAIPNATHEDIRMMIQETRLS